MDMIGKVRRLKLRDQFSLSKIAKRTCLSRNTVKKWLKALGEVVPKYERGSAEGKAHRLRAVPAPGPNERQPSAQTGPAHRPPCFPRSGCKGYRGGDSAVTDYI
jgi:hypothetical protein